MLMAVSRHTRLLVKNFCFESQGSYSLGANFSNSSSGKQPLEAIRKGLEIEPGQYYLAAKFIPQRQAV
jgi:hypothetical protein